MKVITLLLMFAFSSMSHAGDVKKEIIGQKACSYETISTKEVCMRDFWNYGSNGKNSLEIIVRACIYAVGGDHFDCILGLIDDNTLVYQPTKGQLQKQLEYKKSSQYTIPRTKCHIEADITDCLESEIKSFLQSAETFKIPLNLPLVI